MFNIIEKKSIIISKYCLFTNNIYFCWLMLVFEEENRLIYTVERFLSKFSEEKVALVLRFSVNTDLFSLEILITGNYSDIYSN